MTKVIVSDKPLKDAVCYAYAVVEAPKDTVAEFRAASSTALKIFVNGKEVLARESYHQSGGPDSHIGTATLKAGKNDILIKVCQNNQTEPWAQNWTFGLRITDGLGGALPLTGPAYVAPEKEEAPEEEKPAPMPKKEKK